MNFMKYSILLISHFLHIIYNNYQIYLNYMYVNKSISYVGLNAQPHFLPYLKCSLSYLSEFFGKI